MDIKKGTQGHTSLSPVLSNGKDSFGASLAKRGERLSTALYLVTSFLSDSEPVRARLRTLSVDLVRDASLVRYGTTSSETGVLEALTANIGETLVLLELAFIAGLISEMNFTILKREYVSVRDVVEIKKASRESRTDTILGDTFFGSPFNSVFTNELNQKRIAETTSPAPRAIQKNDEIVSTPAFPKGHSKGQNNIIMSDRMSDKKQTSIKTPVTPIHEVVGKQSNGRISGTQDVARIARSTRILKLVKDNREVTIKDISNHFPELSEKTIQRELVSLTASGALKKIGERRWSRYTLA